MSSYGYSANLVHGLMKKLQNVKGRAKPDEITALFSVLFNQSR